MQSIRITVPKDVPADEYEAKVADFMKDHLNYPYRIIFFEEVRYHNIFLIKSDHAMAFYWVGVATSSII